MVTKFRCKSINLSLYKVNLVRRILGEFTGTGSMGAVEVAPVMVNPAPSTHQQPRRKVLPHVRRKRKPVSETVTADVAPVLVNPAPELMAKLRDRLNSKDSKKSAIESILGEAEEDQSLIPDDADKLLTTKEVEDAKKTVDNTITLDKEDLLQPSLALVAPDTTPNSTRELDPSLVPNRDPALSTILGEKPRTGPTTVKTESVSPKKPEAKVEQKLDESSSLPSLEMPRPPGEFLRSIGDITGEGREEKPKVELVMGSSSSPVGDVVSEGMLGASEMPTPKEANIDRTMDAFRRFHRVKI